MSQTQPPARTSDADSVVVQIPVAWGDMDAFNHVNNTVYFRYFETSRIAYFERLGVLGGSPGIILASTTCRFRAPVTYPDTVLASTRVMACGTDRMKLEHQVWSEALQTVAARGEAEIVCYDYAKNAKAPIPETWRQAIIALQGSAPDAM